MPMDRIMELCLKCDHCRMRFGVADLDFEEGNALTYSTPQVFNRDRISTIHCAKGMIRDTDGVPRVYRSQTALKSAVGVIGECPFYEGEVDED